MNAQHQHVILTLLAWTTAAATCCNVAAFAASPRQPKVVWRTGDRFAARLDEATTATWKNIGLRVAAVSLAQAKQTAVFIDRRLDPSTPVSLTVDAVPLRDVFRQLAGAAEGDAAFLDGVVYLGPAGAAKRLRSLAELRRRDLSAAASRRNVRWRGARQELAWPTLTEPRQLLKDLARRERLKIERLEAIPHDLWAEGDLPALDMADLLSLLLVGFDLTFEVRKADQSIVLTRIPEHVRVSQVYPAARGLDVTTREVLANVPEAEVFRRPGGLEVHATVEEHERLRLLLSPSRNRPVRRGAGAPRVQVRVQADIRDKPLDGVLRDFAEKMKFELQFESIPASGPGSAAEARVTVAFDGAMSPAELFAALTRDTPFQASVSDHSVIIRPRAASAE